MLTTCPEVKGQCKEKMELVSLIFSWRPNMCVRVSKSCRWWVHVMHLEFDLTIKRNGKEKMMYDLGAFYFWPLNMLLTGNILERRNMILLTIKLVHFILCTARSLPQTLLDTFDTKPSGLFEFDQLQENEIAIELEFQRFRINREWIEFRSTHSNLWNLFKGQIEVSNFNRQNPQKCNNWNMPFNIDLWFDWLQNRWSRDSIQIPTTRITSTHTTRTHAQTENAN